MHTVKRRRTTIRNTLLAGVAAVALTAVAPEAALAQENPGWFGSIEGRYLKSFGEAIDLSVSYVNYSYLRSVPVDLDDGFGGKLMLGYRFPPRSPQWDIAAAISGGSLDGDSVSAYYYESRIEFVDAKADTEADYFVIDFETGYNVGLGNPGHVRAFGGLRFARFDQDARLSGDFYIDYIYKSSGEFEAKRDVDFWGVGPRVGVSGVFPFGDSNFSVVGGAAAAVLFGERETTDSISYVYSRGRGSGDYSYSESDDDFEIVGNLEADLGVSYAVANKAGMNIDIAAGWRVETWFGVNNTDWNVIGPIFGELGSSDGDQLMHGPFLRVTITPGGAQRSAAKPRGGAVASRMAPAEVSQPPPLARERKPRTEDDAPASKMAPAEVSQAPPFARVRKPRTEVVAPAPPREPPRTAAPMSPEIDSAGEKKPGAPEPSVTPDAEVAKVVVGPQEARRGEVDRGSREHIMWVQRSLNQILGTSLAVDGILGPRTESAIRSFQSGAGIGVDGIVGPRTEDALIKGGANPPGAG